MNVILGYLYTVIIFGLAVGFGFLLDCLCKPAGLKDTAWVGYVISWFIYHMCWAALSYMEKKMPSWISNVFSNIGFWLLFTVTTLAFINISWWVVLICIPVNWLFAGYLGGWLARHIPIVYIYPAIGTAALSFLFHCYYDAL